MLSVSILGLYQFNPGVFDLLTLPEGVDRDALLHNLIAECSDFCLLYPDWDFMRAMIGVWSTNEGKIWEAMQRSVTVEYNPIENYNSTEKEKYNTDMNVSNNEDINTFGLGTTSSDGRPIQKTNVDVTTTGVADKNYIDLVLNQSLIVSFAAKW